MALLSKSTSADASSTTINESPSSPCDNEQQSYALARVRKSGVEEQLVPIFANSFFPSLTKYVSKSKDGYVNTSHFEHATFSMNSILQHQIFMAIQPHPEHPSKRVRIATTALNVTGNFANLSTDLFSPITDDDAFYEKCKISQVDALARIGKMSISLDFGLEADNETITFVPQEAFDVSDFSLNLELSFDEKCHEETRQLVLNELDQSSNLHQEFTAEAQSLLDNRISRFILEHVGVRTTSLSRIPPIKGNTGRIQTVLNIEAFMVSGDHVVLKGGPIFTSVLARPAWRAGRSYTPQASSLGWNLREDKDKLVGCWLGTSGLNALAESAWYLSWSEAPTTEEVMAQTVASILCEPSPNDPCPFPPMIAPSNSAINLALGAFFLPSGLFSNFTVSLLVPPPKFRFHENPSRISGTTSCFMYIDGTSRWSGQEVRLANITMPVSVTATIPTYDAATGYFHGLRLENVRVEDPITTFPRQPYINKLAKFPFHFAEGAVNKRLEEVEIPQANANLEQALSKMPLYINPLKNVPRKGLSMHFSLQSVGISAVGQSGEGDDSYLTLDADLRVTVSDDSLDPGLHGECGGAEPGTCNA